MIKIPQRTCTWLIILGSFIAISAWGQNESPQVGREVAIPVHLQDGEEFTTPIRQLIQELPFRSQLTPAISQEF